VSWWLHVTSACASCTHSAMGPCSGADDPLLHATSATPAITTARLGLQRSARRSRTFVDTLHLSPDAAEKRRGPLLLLSPIGRRERKLPGKRPGQADYSRIKKTDGQREREAASGSRGTSSAANYLAEGTKSGGAVEVIFSNPPTRFRWGTRRLV
jgi:hypothetical protein